MKIKKSALIHSYSQSMGIEAAKELVTGKIKSAALEEKELYTEEETARIISELIKEGGLIGIVAQNFIVQLERKRSEEQALLLDNIENHIWYLTDKKTYGIVNKAHAEFIGLEKEQLEGRDLHDIINAEEADVCIANNREVFEKKKQSHTEEWIKNGRGKTRLLSITRTPKLDDNGNVEYVICAAEDITKRKQAEEELRESEEKYSKLTEQLPVAIAVLDNNENTVYANRKYLETIGYICENQKLSDWFLHAYPDEEYRKWVVEKWYADIEKSVREGKDVEPFEYNVTCKDGEVRVMEISGTWIGDNFVTIFNNVTERVQAKAELHELNEELEQRVIERTAELEKKNKDLERMVNVFTGREIRMAELKGIIKALKEQIASRDNKTE